MPWSVVLANVRAVSADQGHRAAAGARAADRALAASAWPTRARAYPAVRRAALKMRASCARALVTARFCY